MSLIVTRRVGEKLYITFEDGTVVEIMIWGTRRTAKLSGSEQLDRSDWSDGSVDLKFEKKSGKNIDIVSGSSASQRSDTLKDIRDFNKKKSRKRKKP